MPIQESPQPSLAIISYAQATALIAAAVRTAAARSVKLGLVVLDAAGHLVAAGRMDGAPFITTEVARGKAFACVATGGQPGTNLAQRFEENPMVWGNAGPLGYGAPLFPAQGALPIHLDGVLVGAIGASGAPSAIDEAVIAEAIGAIGGSPTP